MHSPGLFTFSSPGHFEDGRRYFQKNQDKKWLISRKYDGIRCLVKINNGHVQAFSRNGKRLQALEPLEEMLAPHCKNVQAVLDGEVCYIEIDGRENFTNCV